MVLRRLHAAVPQTLRTLFPIEPAVAGIVRTVYVRVDSKSPAHGGTR